MRNFWLDLADFRRAGVRRARAADDLTGEIFSKRNPKEIAEFLDGLKTGMLPIAGGAQAFLAGTANTSAFAATPGTLLFGPLIPTWESPLTLAIAGIFEILNTAAANGVTFCYNPTTPTLGGAATGATVYPVQATYPTGTATQVTVATAAAVPAAGLNLLHFVTGIGAAAAVANNQAFFGLLSFQ